MHTIKLQVDDTMYNEIVKSGINIQENLMQSMRELLLFNNYPAITENEAIKRVQNSVNEIESNKAELISNDEADKEIDEFIETL
ncbi:MAG: hypothetical protein COB17_00935 [Sulfurimonas sp.]|nr:MAG: hypothetical protein COB17_00935 [Sulfurimonas sp.]